MIIIFEHAYHECFNVCTIVSKLHTHIFTRTDTPLLRNVHIHTHNTCLSTHTSSLTHLFSVLFHTVAHTHMNTCTHILHALLSLLGSPASLLDLGLHHQDYQVCQVLRPRHRLLAAALLPHGAAGDPLRDAAPRGGQRHQGEGKWATPGLPPT